jgi:hypothetical protein
MVSVSSGGPVDERRYAVEDQADPEKEPLAPCPRPAPRGVLDGAAGTATMIIVFA